MNQTETKDLQPNEIRANLALKCITQSAIARALNVQPSAIQKVIDGISVSDRIRRAVAAAIDMEVNEVWPSVYLNGGPRSPGRPLSDAYHNHYNKSTFRPDTCKS